jgi:hypothetical protein
MEEEPIRAIDALPYSRRGGHRGGKVRFFGRIESECLSGRVVSFPFKYLLAFGRATLVKVCKRRVSISNGGKLGEWEALRRHSGIACCCVPLRPFPLIAAAFTFVESERAQPVGRRR